MKKKLDSHDENKIEKGRAVRKLSIIKKTLENKQTNTHVCSKIRRQNI